MPDKTKSKKEKIASKKKEKKVSSSSESSDEEMQTDIKKKVTKKAESSSSSSSESSSEEKPAKKVTKKGAEKPTKKAKKAKESSSSSSSSSSESSSEEKPAKKVTKKADSSSSSTSESSDSSSDKKPAKKVTKKAASSSSSSSSEEKPKKKASKDSSSSSSSSGDSSGEEDPDEKPTLKRKAEAEPKQISSAKKIKTENGAAPVGDAQNNRLWIGNLSYSIDDDKTKEFFSDCGEITKIDWVTDKQTGKFYGTGFVTFESDEAAEKALEKNGQDLLGRPIKIDRSKSNNSNNRFSKDEGRGKFANGGNKRDFGAKSDRDPNSVTIFVGNLSFQIDEDVLRSTFAKCGEVSSIRWVNNKQTGEFSGCAFVDFVDPASTEAAVALAGTKVLGRQIRVDFSGNKPRPNRF